MHIYIYTCTYIYIYIHACISLTSVSKSLATGGMKSNVVFLKFNVCFEIIVGESIIEKKLQIP